MMQHLHETAFAIVYQYFVHEAGPPAFVNGAGISALRCTTVGIWKATNPYFLSRDPIGVLITDEDYRPTMENMSYAQMSRNINSLKSCDPNFLEELRIAHDHCFCQRNDIDDWREAMETQLRAFALRWNIRLPYQDQNDPNEVDPEN